MCKTILAILGAAPIAGATVQFAAAAKRHHAGKAARGRPRRATNFATRTLRVRPSRRSPIGPVTPEVTQRRPVARPSAKIKSSIASRDRLVEAQLDSDGADVR
jgi:hypothetical protein